MNINKPIQKALPRNAVSHGFFFAGLDVQECSFIVKALQRYLEEVPNEDLQRLADRFHAGGLAAAYSYTIAPHQQNEALALLQDVGL